jgi:hypothetical protein
MTVLYVCPLFLPYLSLSDKNIIIQEAVYKYLQPPGYALYFCWYYPGQVNQDIISDSFINSRFRFTSKYHGDLN